MDVFSLDDLKTLIEVKSSKCDVVSIFMPTYKTGAETKQNPTVLENLLTQAESQLLAASFKRGAEVHKYVSPVKELLNSKAAWQHPQNGLAIFLYQDLFRYYSLPLSFKESVSVGARFSTRPLLPLFNSAGRFYVLALSQNAVRLIQCTRDSTSEINLAGIVPTNMAEALSPHKSERNLQFHGGMPGKGKESSVFQGQGPEKLDENNIALFVQQINHGLTQKLLHNESAPLVIAGVKDLFPVYKKANTYKPLYHEGIAGNPDKLSNEVLKERAIALLQPYFEKNETNAIHEYRELQGTGHTTNDIAVIATNSYLGQVEKLLIASEAPRWGSFDTYTNTVSRHDMPESCDYDLIDFAAVNTLVHRGTVSMIKPDSMPDGSAVGAVLRHEKHLPKTGHPGTA